RQPGLAATELVLVILLDSGGAAEAFVTVNGFAALGEQGPQIAPQTELGILCIVRLHCLDRADRLGAFHVARQAVYLFGLFGREVRRARRGCHAPTRDERDAKADQTR